MYNQRNGGGGGFNRGGGSSFGNRGGDKPMFKTVCAECNQNTEVPFKPNGSKPVYCRDCFRKQDGGGDFAPRGSSYGNDRPSFGGDKQMFPATCAKCGNSTEVPFRPSGDKPVFCRDCFKKEGGPDRRSSAPAGADNGEQFRTLNAKLDQLIKLLTPAAPAAKAEEKKSAKVEAPKAEAKADVAAPAAKAKPAKKAAAAKKKK